MAPVKCYYHDCINTNATKSIFTFPINDEPRLKLWIKHSGKRLHYYYIKFHTEHIAHSIRYTEHVFLRNVLSWHLILLN